MDDNRVNILKIKKFMSFVLRHKPFFYNIKLDSNGAADTDVLINAIRKHLNLEINKPNLVEIAKNMSGGMFKVSKDGSSIAARHGHTFIYNMNIPEGYELCEMKSLPNELYAVINKTDFLSYINADVIPLSNKSIKLHASEPKNIGNDVVMKILTKKLDEKKTPVYYNKESNTYFTKFITKNSVALNV
jgi:RNA:NAD 2'-phosphotransferase (TPT1/KptA family)